MTDSLEKLIVRYKGTLAVFGGLVAVIIWALRIDNLPARVDVLEGQQVQMQAQLAETRSDLSATLCILVAQSEDRAGRDCELLMSPETRTRLQQHRRVPR